MPLSPLALPILESSACWVKFKGTPLGAAQGLAPHNAHLPVHFLGSVLDGSSSADVSMLAFRDPHSFVAGNLHFYYQFWQLISRSAPCDLASEVLKWIKECVNVYDFFWPFNGQFKGESFDSCIPPTKVFPNNLSCQSFVEFIDSSIASGLQSGAVSLWGKVGEVQPPHLVMPLTVEPSKPRLCHDNRFLNLWIKDNLSISSRQPFHDPKVRYEWLLSDGL